MSDIDEEARSTDGSDSEGSLVDFITKDNSDEEEEEEVEEDNRDEATQLIEDFPFDRSLLEEDNTSGLRRSRRQRKQITRYVDPDNYNKLMFGDVDENALNSSSEDENVDEEDDFVVDDDDMEDSTDDDDEEEEEEQPAKKRKISSKITTTPDTKPDKKRDVMKMC